MLDVILTAEQIKKADAYTIKHEPIASIDLMERASKACVSWIEKNIQGKRSFKVFCGTGNNGGDGLAICRLLLEKGHEVQPFIIRHNKKMSTDASRNEARLMQKDISLVRNIYQINDLAPIESNDIVIDALFGIGLNKEVKGLAAHVIDYINESMAEVIGIDMPSGMLADHPSQHFQSIIKADHTLSFQTYKQAFLYNENQYWLGDIHLLNIGLDQSYLQSLDRTHRFYDHTFCLSKLRHRDSFSHKGNFGHALLIAGQKGMMGAAILSAKAAMRSGLGLCTAYLPGIGLPVMHSTVPEVICMASEKENYISGLPDLKKYKAIAIGPGIGNDDKTVQTLSDLLSISPVPLIIDADAINLLATHQELFPKIPELSVLTPHPKEFDRLCGKSSSDFERNEKQIAFAQAHKVYVLIKGKNSCIACPDGTCYINTSGNAGMATAGTGDVLSGILLALMAQGYTPNDAVLMAVNIHGLAGDFALEEKGMHAMMAGDLIDQLPVVFKSLENIR